MIKKMIGYIFFAVLDYSLQPTFKARMRKYK